MVGADGLEPPTRVGEDIAALAPAAAVAQRAQGEASRRIPIGRYSDLQLAGTKPFN